MPSFRCLTDDFVTILQCLGRRYPSLMEHSPRQTTMQLSRYVHTDRISQMSKALQRSNSTWGHAIEMSRTNLHLWGTMLLKMSSVGSMKQLIRQRLSILSLLMPKLLWIINSEMKFRLAGETLKTLPNRWKCHLCRKHRNWSTRFKQQNLTRTH